MKEVSKMILNKSTEIEHETKKINMGNVRTSNIMDRLTWEICGLKEK
jgi:hypothetical protein